MAAASDGRDGAEVEESGLGACAAMCSVLCCVVCGDQLARASFYQCSAVNCRSPLHLRVASRAVHPSLSPMPFVCLLRRGSLPAKFALLQAPPLVPSSIPFLGRAQDFGERPIDFLLECREKVRAPYRACEFFCLCSIGSRITE